MNWSAVGAFTLGLAVAFGAFGAHSLRDSLDAYSTGVYEKAVFYHFIHAIALLIAPIFVRSGMLAEQGASRVCWLLITGILIFSGSLYLLAVTGARSLGAITPIGGTAFLAAWALLGWGLMRHKNQ